MSKMKKYIVYIDDGRKTHRLPTPATSMKKARQCWEGNGDIVCVKELKDYDIPLADVRKALYDYGFFCEDEIDFIARTLLFSGIAE